MNPKKAMCSSNTVTSELIPEQVQIQFVGKKEISKITGLSGETLKKYRLRGRLVEGIHWIRINSKVVRYNVPLIRDWIQNINNPGAHNRAIEAYFASLPSNRQSKRGRKAS